MKNNDWLTLPIFLFGYLPKRITDLAENIASHKDEIDDLAIGIARKEGIEPGLFVKRAFPRDKMDIIETIQEHPENLAQTAIWFEDEDFHIVNLPYEKCLNKIHKFLSSEATYREGISETEVHYHVAPVHMSQEERDEMEGEDDSD